MKASYNALVDPWHRGRFLVAREAFSAILITPTSWMDVRIEKGGVLLLLGGFHIRALTADGQLVELDQRVPAVDFL